MDKQPDSLVDRLRSADRLAAAELVDLYYKQIYHYIRRMGFGYAASEDLTQNVFFQAWQHIAQLRSDKMLRPWLYRIATNAARTELRKKRRDTSLEEDDLVDGSSQSWEKIENKELLLQLKNEIDNLPTKLKQAILLHYMQHLTIEETADAACVGQGTIKSRISRALEKLRKQLKMKNGKCDE